MEIDYACLATLRGFLRQYVIILRFSVCLADSIMVVESGQLSDSEGSPSCPNTVQIACPSYRERQRADLRTQVRSLTLAVRNATLWHFRRQTERYRLMPLLRRSSSDLVQTRPQRDTRGGAEDRGAPRPRPQSRE